MPTQSAEDLYRSAERVEDELAAAERRVAGRDADPTGLVRLSLPPAVLRGFLAPEIAAFARHYPGIELAIETTDMFSDLVRREADVSVRMAHEVTDDVVGRRLLRYAQAIYAAPPVAEVLTRARDADRSAVAWIGWGDETAPGWTRDTPFPDLPVRHRLNGHAAQLEAARAGLGLTMLPCFLGDTEPGLVRVPGTRALPDRNLWLLLHGDLRKTARVRALVDFIAPAILKHRALLEGRRPARRPNPISTDKRETALERRPTTRSSSP